MSPLDQDALRCCLESLLATAFKFFKMPPAKPKPSEIAVEAKKSYIPYIRQTFSYDYPPTSYLCDAEFMAPTSSSPNHVCRFGKKLMMTACSFQS